MQITIIAGNVGKDAELRNTQGGDQFASFSVAVDNGKDGQGNRRDSTWWDCTIWGKRATSLAPFITKGSKITLSGRPSVRVHDGKAYLQLSSDQVTLQGGKQERTPMPEGFEGTAPAQADIADSEIPF